MRTLFIPGLILAASAAFGASPYTVHNLISDIPNPTGTTDPNIVVDPNLVDPWGIAISASSPFWISNAGTGTATIYSFNATVTPTCGTTLAAISAAPCAYTVNTAATTTVPSASGGPARVTGQIAGAGLNFAATPGGPFPSFLFCTEDGTISVRVAPSNTTAALITVNNNGSAVYKGCAAAVTPDGSRFFAANFKAGTVDVFDTSWSPVTTSGGFHGPESASRHEPVQCMGAGSESLCDLRHAGPGWGERHGRPG